MIVKNCVNCGDEFSSRNPRQKYCQENKTKNCPTCKQDFTYNCEKRVRVYCGPKCAALSPERNKKIKQTTLKKYGVENILLKPEVREKAIKESMTEEAKQKREQTLIEKYGVSNPMFLSENVEKVRETQKQKYGAYGFNTEKQKQTMLERYGVEVPAKNPEVAEKIRETQMKNNNGVFAFNTEKQAETMINLYGGKGRLSSPAEMDKQIKTMLERYGVRTPCENPEFPAKAQEKYGSIFNNNIISKINKNFSAKLNALGIETEFEKFLDGKYFDIFLPQHNILIELNPTITHNSTISFTCIRKGCMGECDHLAKPNNYHYQKSLLAQKEGLILIHKYDWDEDDSIIKLITEKTMVKTVKYSAHKLIVKKISQKDANIFFNTHHIQGGASKQSYCYGLFDGDTMVSAASFGGSRFNKNFEYEFIRYAVSSGIVVYGGAAKIFKAFVEEVGPETVVSYIDFNHTSKQDVFLHSLGFVELGNTGPTLYWDKLRGRSRKVSQNALNRLGADRLLGTSYGSVEVSGLKNEDIMLREGFVKVYTAGNRVFVWG